MKIINEDVELVPVGALKPHPRNPRESDVGAIYESIQANGFYGAIVVQRSTGYILAGNHRWRAAAEAGASEVPVMWVDVDDAHALRILLADNRTNDLASYDMAELADLLQEIVADAGTLAGTGYDGDALDELLADLAAPPTVLGDSDEVEKDQRAGSSPWSRVGSAGDRARCLCGDVEFGVPRDVLERWAVALEVAGVPMREAAEQWFVRHATQ